MSSSFHCPKVTFLFRGSLVVLFAAATFSACAAPASDASDYLPVNEGNEWITDAVFTAPDGQTSKGTGHRKIEGRLEVHGKTYFRVHNWIEGAPSPMDYTKLIRKDAKGIYSIDERVKEANEKLEIPWPLQVGQSWVTLMGPMTFKNTVVAIESVTLGKEKYDNCYHIHTAAVDGSYLEDYWEAPKAGNIKAEIIYGRGNKITLTLREFKAGK